MTLQELLKQAASLYPDREAVCFDECNGKPPASHTYTMVVKLATELTAFLQERCGQQGKCEIGLYCYPGVNLPAWILGILQVPAAYSPIDPDAPPMVSAYFMRKINLQYVLVENDKVNKFQRSHAGWFYDSSSSGEHVGLTLFRVSSSTTDVNSEAESVKRKHKVVKPAGDSSQSGSTLSPDWNGGNVGAGQEASLAYVLHTSGTTGVPKVVRVPHRCIVPNIQHLKSLFEVTQEDVLFLASPLTFDPSVVELFVALTSGASVLIVPNAVKMMPVELSAALFHHHRVTVLQATPTLFRRFGADVIKSTVLSAHTSLRVLALGGEAFPALSLLRSWKHEENRTSVFNLYGVTEVSSWATCYQIPEEVFGADFRTDFPVPLGSPLLGTKIEVRGASGSTVLEGEGQMFIGGEERVCFLDDEVTVPPGTMRATGDFVRVQDAQFFFLGRKDNQIKRHGKRLNVECLQQAAEDLSQVEACAVSWYQQEKLLLFVVPRGVLEERETLGELQKRVPAHAVPDELVLIEALPVTPHGKVDLLGLHQIYQSRVDSRRRDSEPSGAEDLWEGLQYLWKSVLGLPGDSSGVSKEAVFLHSGGDSLKALRFHDEIEMLVGQAVPGLLDVILSHSVGEVYRHTLEALSPGDGRGRAAKRKVSGGGGEEGRDKHVRLEPQRALEGVSGFSSFLALSRGNRIFSMDFSKSFVRPGGAAQAGEELLQQPPFLRVVTPGVLKSRGQGSATENGAFTVTEKTKGTDGFSVQQTHADGRGAAPAEVALRVRWKSNTRKCVDASPLVVVPSAGKAAVSVYVGSHSHAMQALDLDSGELRWEKTLGDRIESSACASRCGGFVVVGCYDGLVYVLRSSDGEVHWTFATGDSVKSSAVVDPSSGLVYVGSHDQHTYALDIYAKACVWSLHCQGGAVFSSPCLSASPHHLYVATLGGLLLAVNPVTGKKIWKSVLGKPLFSSPHCNEKSVCVGCVDGNLYCYTHSGEKVWQFSTKGPVFSSPCISSLTEQGIFVGSHDRFIYCCGAEGTLLWKFEATSSVYGTPFVFHSGDVKDKVLLAAASTDGNVWILDAKSGRAEGVDKLPGEVFSSPVVWGTKLVVGCRNDYVYCLELGVTAR
ncbi:ACSF4 enzyme, partial [Rhinopomastus cyanomelas]|nr:ACSF4 enzyme [Rhinopomastus cyanomelas]